MTDDKKHDDKDRKKLSDEELEDVAGGTKLDLNTSSTFSGGDTKGKRKGGPQRQEWTGDALEEA